ncbi:MAG TPA: hypothetical protein VGI96_26865 [Streptosporangiaceae bacterium]
MGGDAAAEAAGLVAAVRDDPARRLRLAGSFYDDRPGRPSIGAYRRAEVAFMHWQLRRGLLAAPGSARPGSQWWRAVNEDLLRDAWEADRLAAGRPGPASSAAVSRWADFLRWPSAVSWYRAHNASIVAGYLRHQELCAAELPIERFFMNVTLSRVLYAHALVARPRLALGRVRAVSRPLGDPRWRGADLFLSLHRILPDQYPLDGVTLSEILVLENHAGRLIDYGVIVPRIQALFDWAAADLGEPRLLGLVRDGLPAYAWTNGERHPWTPVRGHRIMPVLTWLTS